MSALAAQADVLSAVAPPGSEGLTWLPTALGVPSSNCSASVDHAPYDEHDDRAHDRADESSTLVWAVPPDCLAKKSCDEGPGDSKERRKNETGGFSGARVNELGDDPGDEADNDNPNEMHVSSPLRCSPIQRGGRIKVLPASESSSEEAVRCQNSIAEVPQLCGGVSFRYLRRGRRAREDDCHAHAMPLAGLYLEASLGILA